VEHTGKNIALPATFVVARDGHVAFQRVGESMIDRVNSPEIIAELDRLAAEDR
jgi:hypothetical protein